MLPGPVCVSLTPTRVSDIFEAPIEGADCVEARLDYLDDPAESSLVQWNDLPVPTIATCRGRSQGGRFGGTIDEELKLLAAAVRNGAQFVDVDYRFATEFGGAQVIGSYHDFERTPDDLDNLIEAVCRTPAAIAKVATMVRCWSDNRRLLALLDRPWPKPVIVIGMGEMGEITRVVGPSRGSVLTYSSAGQPSAPGQLGLTDIVDTYRVRDLVPETGLIGIVGNPVAHSRSPQLHNRAFHEAGLDFVYMRFKVDDVGDFFENAARIGIVGFSVTIPHKVEVMRYLDGVSPEAAAVGAVNTVYRRNGKWMGDNTDVYGIQESLKDVSLAESHVVILGSGGAARAAVAALGEAVSVTLLSRSREPGRLEWSRRVEVDSIDNYSKHDADLLINATPIGMSPDVDESPLSEPIRADVVFDMVYNPPRTRLMRDAEEQGRTTIGGTTMFVAQASRQFEIWTGRSTSSELLRAAMA
jgi:3-dehydroquinate dehydratase/shikimate dehydrogenase